MVPTLESTWLKQVSYTTLYQTFNFFFFGEYSRIKSRDLCYFSFLIFEIPYLIFKFWYLVLLIWYLVVRPAGLESDVEILTLASLVTSATQ